jgi:hypothetical protein
LIRLFCATLPHRCLTDAGDFFFKQVTPAKFEVYITVMLKTVSGHFGTPLNLKNMKTILNSFRVRLNSFRRTCTAIRRGITRGVTKMKTPPPTPGFYLKRDDGSEYSQLPFGLIFARSGAAVPVGIAWGDDEKGFPVAIKRVRNRVRSRES